MRRPWTALAAGVALLAAAVPAFASEPVSACPTPAALLAIEPALTHVATKIAAGRKLTIVAIGSSSTQGIGASSPTLSYPGRLEAELRKRFPTLDIRVINRGRGGEDAPEELARFERDVIAEDPDLVIWQIGTNAVLRRLDTRTERDVLRQGIALIKESASDVLLMDMQYAPSVIARPAYLSMQKLIAEVAERNRVGLFRRFEIMRHWLASERPEAVIGPDGLHMTDRSYSCLASGLAEAITRNWQEYRQAQLARASRFATMLSPMEAAADAVGSDEP